jgi:hypothetical protein
MQLHDDCSTLTSWTTNRRTAANRNGEFEQDQRPPTEPKEVHEEEEYACAHGAREDQGFL